MSGKEEKKNITIDDLAVMMAEGFSGLETRLTKKIDGVAKDLDLFKLDTNIHFSNIETDLKSFKNDTKESFHEINEKLDDVHDTVMNHDKRIEVLETK